MNKEKRWVLLFLLILGIGIGGYMLLCYSVNPLGYFTNQKGLDYFDNEDFARKIKATYLYEHRGEVEGVTVGGSKSGSVDPSIMQELTGLSYYNFYMNVGNFADYLRYITFFVEQCDIKEVTLVLGNFETEGYDQTYKGNAYDVPAILSGSLYERVPEPLGYLMTDLNTVIDRWKQNRTYNILNADCIYDGMRNRRSVVLRHKRKAEKIAQRSVLLKKDKQLAELFSQKASSQTAREPNLEALKQIRDLCQAHDVNFRVIVSASFLLDKARYECDEFYDYFEQIVRICGEVWDFSDYNPINMNPYNYYDRSHCTREVSELVMRTALQEGFEGYEGFGQLLTPDNVHEAMQRRKAQYEALKEEYDATGDIVFETMEDDSYIPWATEWSTPGMEKSAAIMAALEK